MENVVTLKQFVGQVAGSSDPDNLVYYPTDEIRCNDRKIGFVDHKEGSSIRLIRVLSEPTRKEIHDKVAAIRKELGGPAIADYVAQPPDPEHMRAYLEKLKAQQSAAAAEDDDE